MEGQARVRRKVAGRRGQEKVAVREPQKGKRCCVGGGAYKGEGTGKGRLGGKAELQASQAQNGVPGVRGKNGEVGREEGK